MEHKLSLTPDYCKKCNFVVEEGATHVCPPSCCDTVRREVIETLLLKLPAKTTTESEGILLDIYVPFNEGYNRAIQEIRALLNEQRG